MLYTGLFKKRWFSLILATIILLPLLLSSCGQKGTAKEEKHVRQYLRELGVQKSCVSSLPDYRTAFTTGNHAIWFPVSSLKNAYVSYSPPSKPNRDCIIVDAEILYTCGWQDIPLYFGAGDYAAQKGDLVLFDYTAGTGLCQGAYMVLGIDLLDPAIESALLGKTEGDTVSLSCSSCTYREFALFPQKTLAITITKVLRYNTEKSERQWEGTREEFDTWCRLQYSLAQGFAQRNLYDGLSKTLWKPIADKTTFSLKAEETALFAERYVEYLQTDGEKEQTLYFDNNAAIDKLKEILLIGTIAAQRKITCSKKDIKHYKEAHFIFPAQSDACIAYLALRDKVLESLLLTE